MVISLVVPIYNVKPFLEEFLHSVESQTYKDFEAILVDDGSNDGTETILDAYAVKNAYFHVIHKENGGVVSAWKQGVLESKGDYITFADPDDILKPNMLQEMYRLLTENDADMVITGMERYENKQIFPMEADTWQLREGVYIDEELERLKVNLFGSLQKKQNIFHFARWNKLFKREIVLNNLNYSREDIAFGDDVCICASSIYDSKKLYYSHTPLYMYRIRDNSLTTVNFSMREVDNAERLVNAVRKMVTEKGYMNEFIYYNDPSWHIVRFMRKINKLSVSKKDKKVLLASLMEHDFVKSYVIKEAKRYIPSRRYHLISLLKKGKFSFLLFLLRIKEKLSPSN